jgi:hypothetical protein
LEKGLNQNKPFGKRFKPKQNLLEKGLNQNQTKPFGKRFKPKSNLNETYFCLEN